MRLSQTQRVSAAWAGRAAWALCVVAFATLLGGPSAMAQTLCSEPLTPLCLRDGREFGWSALSWQRCRQDVERHLGELRDYRVCLDRKAQEARAGEKALEALIECAGETPEGCVGRNLPPDQR